MMYKGAFCEKSSPELTGLRGGWTMDNATTVLSFFYVSKIVPTQ